MRLVTTFMFIFSGTLLFSQNWNRILPETIVDKGIKDIQPQKYTLYTVDDEKMKNLLWGAPNEEETTVKSSNTIVQVGLPGGQTTSFRVVRYAMMEPTLSDKYPEIRTFYGTSTTMRGCHIRIDYTLQGFRAVISSIDSDKIFIDHYQRGDKNTRIVYYKKDYKKMPSWGCNVDEEFIKSQAKIEDSGLRIGDCNFRSYRLAQAATGEYSNYHGAFNSGQSALVLSAVTTGINRINEVYETEVAVRLILVANTTQIFYYNPSTDPYTGTSASTMLGENITTCNNVIGSPNYDIGHVFGGLGGNGVAYLNAVCSSNKAGGVTTSSQPVNDPFFIDYVAHEVGHQFGGNHTQNNQCNRNSNTAMEPGSASSIMGYAGICDPNVQSNSDAYFHAINLQEIKNFLLAGGGNCDQFVPNYNNSAPIVNPVINETIPKSTPFVLTLVATDPDDDPLVYAWEQMNNQTATMPPVATNNVGPAFRSIYYTSSPKRYFPNLSTILAGNTANTWEVVPSVGRTMNFRGVVRDVAEAGSASCNSEVNMIVTTVAAAGPFLVTSNNTASVWLEGENKTITWDVAGTTGNGVNCNTVDILLSYDGGQTFLTNLASAVPNTGSYTIVVPEGTTTTGRILVRGTGRIFFDINNANITIDPGFPSFSIISNPISHTICTGQSKFFEVSVNPILGFSNAVTLSTPGLPTGYSASFSVNPVTPGNNSILTVTNISAAPGINSQTINGMSGAINKNILVSITSVNVGSLGTPTLITPVNNGSNINIKPTFSWTPVSGAEEYEVQITRRANFSEIIYNFDGITGTSYSITGTLEGGTEYFWRVRGVNVCETGNWSTPFSYTTEPCFIYSASDLPIPIPVNGPNLINSYIQVSDKGVITDLDVLNLTGLHTWISDLKFTLFAPNNTNVVFWDSPCNDQDNFNINFNQTAPPGTWPCPPVNGGTYQPSNSLNTFNTLNLKGQWRLRVEDQYDQDGGSLETWGIKTCLNSFCRLLVDNSFERGAGSLFDAVSCAAPGDTIRFSSQLNNDTIYLGNQNLFIDKELVLECEISRNIHVMSSSSSPVILNTAPGTGLGLRIRGLHIHSSNNNIGAIDNRGKLMLDNVILYKFQGTSAATIQNRTGSSVEILGNLEILED